MVMMPCHEIVYIMVIFHSYGKLHHDGNGEREREIKRERERVRECHRPPVLEVYGTHF